MENTDDYAHALEQQRLAFEAQFGTLESMGFEDATKNTNISDEKFDEIASSGSSEDEQSEYSESDSDSEAGTSSPIELKKKVEISTKTALTKTPRVIKFKSTDDAYVAPSRKQQKLVRSGKSLAHLKEQEDKDDAEEEGNVDTEEQNLQNDIELQQFLQESHLLSAFSKSDATSSGADLTLKTMNNNDVSIGDDSVSGRARARILEMRLNKLSKTNGHAKKISTLEKVPMQVRKGMIKKHMERIGKYEQEAAEGGIVLSKVKKGKFRKIESTYKKDIERRIGQSIKSKDEKRNSMRQRGLKIHSVGRSTRNGLVISQKDINKITKPSKGSFKKGKRR